MWLVCFPLSIMLKFPCLLFVACTTQQPQEQSEGVGASGNSGASGENGVEMGGKLSIEEEQEQGAAIRGEIEVEMGMLEKEVEEGGGGVLGGYIVEEDAPVGPAKPVEPTRLMGMISEFMTFWGLFWQFMIVLPLILVGTVVWWFLYMIQEVGTAFNALWNYFCTAGDDIRTIELAHVDSRTTRAQDISVDIV